MLALSGTQPYFWAILHAGKNIENRNWRTDVRGTIALHAAKNMPKEYYERARINIERIAAQQGRPVIAPAAKDLVRGAIIGTADIVDCIRHSPLAEMEYAWLFGCYGFLLENVRALPEPIPCKGYLGFWKVPTEIEAQIREQLCLKR